MAKDGDTSSIPAGGPGFWRRELSAAKQRLVPAVRKRGSPPANRWCEKFAKPQGEYAGRRPNFPAVRGDDAESLTSRCPAILNCFEYRRSRRSAEWIRIGLIDKKKPLVKSGLFIQKVAQPLRRRENNSNNAPADNAVVVGSGTEVTVMELMSTLTFPTPGQSPM